ncbi:ComEC/Rec2 family competence protein [Chitinophaga sp. GCM10012297]|uniref:ComEC family competence protein n=1 Tax=Chitinophaga chungangae TaxID=2821488 RepID=A0ABS3YDF5_9BACT|nr:ComEC/Rec2 family competence protein [Chitinophaga chungangae]MBO9152714.1 ComEC family competence protein [Chitinophaga chungangae]
MFVNRWGSAPFLRLLLPFVAGVTAGMFFPVIPWPCMAVCMLFLVLPSFFNLPQRFAWRNIRGAALLMLVGCMGMALTTLSDARRDTRWLGHSLKDSMYCIAVLKEPPVKKRQSWKAEAEVVMVRAEKWKEVKGKLLVYFREKPALDYGSRLLFSGAPQRITSSGNPGAFDYARYCAYRNIYHQVFLGAASWQKLPGDGGHRLGRWLNISRQYALDALRKYLPSKEAYGVAQALLVGYRDELDPDVVQAYTNTGVVHIIAISGLHLGLIYVSLLQLLKWLPRKRWVEIAKALLLIAVLWGFSLLTGASASVLRSAVMFTTIAIGQFVIARHSDIFNTLAAAAFLLLCYHPFFLVDAGFQLSFLAVAGIVLCYQPLYDLWMIPYKWPDKLWQMVAVSLAAQAFTWPVCLFYFHQFPNYFLLANIVAVPLSTLLLYGEIVLMMLAEWPPAAGFVGKALEWGIVAMNTVIQWIDRIPGAVASGIPMNMTQMFLLYVFTIALIAAWLLKRKAALWCAAGLMAIFVLYGAVQRIYWQRQRMLVVYNLPKLTVVEYIEGRECCRAGDSAGLKHPQLAAAQLELGVRRVSQYSYIRNGYIVATGGKRLLVLSGGLRYANAPAKKIKIDYILLSHNPKVDISRLQEFFIYDMLIFDASNSAFQLRKWKNACNELPLRCFSVPEQGAFVVNL